MPLLCHMRDDTPARGYSCVFGTYSALKVAEENGTVYEKMAAVYGAYDNTQTLVKLLHMVYHNVRHYFQMQLEMHDVGEVLSSYFDDFGQKVIEAYIRPLKIKDSVPKYRVPIKSVLTWWAEDDSLLEAMAEAAKQDRRGATAEDCRADILRKIYWVQVRAREMELREEGREEGRKEGMDMALCNSIKNVMESLKCTMEKAMDILNIPVESRDKYKKLM